MKQDLYNKNLLAQNAIKINELNNKINELEKKEAAALVNFSSESANNYIFRTKKEIEPSIIDKMLDRFAKRGAKTKR
jgi:hypothetical protein